MSLSGQGMVDDPPPLSLAEMSAKNAILFFDSVQGAGPPAGQQAVHADWRPLGPRGTAGTRFFFNSEEKN